MAKVWLARDGETLLVKTEVHDDQHVQPYSGGETWRGDNIQIGLIVPKQKGWEFGFTRLESGKSEVHVWIAPQSFQPEEAASHAIFVATVESKLDFYAERVILVNI